MKQNNENKGKKLGITISFQEPCKTPLRSYTLNNTDIFDESINEKFREILSQDLIFYDKSKIYMLDVKFHVNLLYDVRFRNYVIKKPYANKKRKITIEDNIHELLSLQLDNIDNILEEAGLYAHTNAILGVQLEHENMIVIEVSEDKDHYEKVGKVNTIMGSLPFFLENASKIASEALTDKYYQLYDIIQNKQIMADILNIKSTNDEDLLMAFVEQYSDFWLCTSEREKEIRKQIIEKAKIAIRKYYPDIEL